MNNGNVIFCLKIILWITYMKTAKFVLVMVWQIFNFRVALRVLLEIMIWKMDFWKFGWVKSLSSFKGFRGDLYNFRWTTLQKSLTWPQTRWQFSQNICSPKNRFKQNNSSKVHTQPEHIQSHFQFNF